jgi:predicted DNA-binding helix-hairpin-helix protein
MRQIQNGIRESRHHYGVDSMKSRMAIDEKTYYNQLAEMKDSHDKLCDYHSARGVLEAEKAAQVAQNAWALGDGMTKETGLKMMDTTLAAPVGGGRLTHADRYFVPAGQSTQMIVGATGESDYQIMAVSEALYNKFDMKRVFYSAFVNVNRDETLPALLEGPPLLREHRLYQADFLLRFYGFKADELLSEQRPNFNEQIDPKCDWAVRHLENFPVEINKADYYTLLRVPGIGTKSAKRIVAARKHGKLGFDDIKKMGVVLKRALYFITCDGRMMYHTPLEEAYITRQLIYGEKPAQLLLPGGGSTYYEQLSIFDFAV